MWHYISGKLITLFIFSIVSKQLISFEQLEIADKLFGWFLLEHIYEEYNKTTGKLFIVNEDFRRLIKNFFKIIRNIFCFGQLITLIEFFLLTFILFVLILFFKKILINKTLNYKSKDIIYIYYYIFIIILLLIKIKIAFTMYDLIFISKTLTVFIAFTVLIYIMKFTINFTNSYLTDNKSKYFYKFILIKTYLYATTTVFYCSTFLFLLTNYDQTTNHYILELSVQLIYVYSYFNYYFIIF